MNSTFNWLDYSEHERPKFDEILTGFNENDTRDELGLGSVRDAFVEILCPRISTIQTRAHYFLFVPWVGQRIEHREERPSVIGAQRRDCLLIHQLPRSGEMDVNLVDLSVRGSVVQFNARDRVQTEG